MPVFFKKFLRKAIWGGLFIFIMINLVAFAHAYKFTHFTHDKIVRTKDPKELSLFHKLGILFTGIDNPKPMHSCLPSGEYKTIRVGGSHFISGWHIQVNKSKGTVLLFHGYAGEKSSLLGRAKFFNDAGFNTLLIDFLGSGDSDGYSTSVGYNEADQVKLCYDLVTANGEKNILLFGTSMGAAAILKCVDEFQIKPSAIILECPFGSLYKTVCARFNLMGIPAFPMAALLTFWGGIQHDYWAFSHNPSTYAKSVTMPTLLLFGEQDDRVTREEIDLIYSNLRGFNMLKTYPQEGHNFYTENNALNWHNDVKQFLSTISTHNSTLLLP